LRERFDLSSEVTWTRFENSCIGNFAVSIKNIGSEEADVPPAFVKVWVIPRPEPTSTREPVFINLDLVKNIEPIQQITVGGTLVHTYRPDASSYESFLFTFEKEANQQALFVFESPTGVPVTWVWSYLCDQSVE